MYSSLIGKIEKAQRYAQERERVNFSRFVVWFQGEHDRYRLGYDEGRWECSCGFFNGRQVCSHTMALERILQGMIPSRTAPAE
ncbi:MAG: hypothetical protein HY535_03175 [Chloroflexi bacterium]|nr:hypothetical protein [Chloroflexota bacterium]